MKKLKKELRHTKRRAVAEGTAKNKLVQWKAFNHFCDKFNLHEWPTSTETLCLFAQHLATRMRSVKSVESYLVGVVDLHLYAGVTPPSLKEFNIKLTLRGIRRSLKHRIKQPKPMTPQLLLKIFKLLYFDRFEDTVFWAILLTGFFLLLRKSNLVPNTQDSFDKTKHLTRKQVKLNKHFVKVTVTWSKTIQFHEKRLTYKMYSLPDSDLCPVKAFTRLFQRSIAELEQSCFLLRDGLPFSYNMLNYRIKKFLKAAKVKKFYKYSAHSLRRGGLLLGFKSGLPKKFLKALGDWRSECFEVYLSFPTEIRDTAAKKIREKLLKMC